VATRNDPVNVPLETEHVSDSTAPPDNEQLVSLDENPEPDTSTVEPPGAVFGFKLREMVVAPVLAVKLPVAESPAGLPVTVTE